MRQRLCLSVYPSHLTDAPSFYRCLGPLAELGRRRPELNVSIHDVTNWVTMASSDAVFLQRPYTQQSLQVCAYAAKQGVPIWIDHDDDLWSIPSDNGAADTYAGAEETIDRILALADIVTVSTEPLARIVETKTKAWVKVVPNGLMTNMVGHVPQHDGKARTAQVLWRGGSTHQRDLDSVGDELVELSRAYGEKVAWTFIGVGRSSYRILEAMPTARRLRGFDPIDYFAALRAMRPRAVVVPLADQRFNKSKSNIGYIEAVYAGAVPIVPDWPEWRLPGAISYKPKIAGSFSEAVRCVLDMDDVVHDRLWQEARNHVEAKLTIETTNNLRCSVLDRLAQLSGDVKWRASKRASIERGV